MRLEDLPVGPLRSKALAKLQELNGTTDDKKDQAPAARHRTDSAPCPGTCLPECGDRTFPTYTSWERHADRNPGRHRWNITLPDPTVVGSPST